MNDNKNLPPDHLNAVGILKRREIEARIIAPLVDALGEEFGHQHVLEVLRQVIIQTAHQHGASIAENMGGDSLSHFVDSLDAWKMDDALQLDVLEQTDEAFNFNVTRCRYAEMYQALGIPELGTLLSCNRDFALIEGFNPQIKLARMQTIMEGALHCDFRFTRKYHTFLQGGE
jgi:hypothetical protein